MDSLGSVLLSYVGLKMQVFRLPKVLVVGKTSGCGGWLKKLALILTKAMGLSSVGSNPKNNEEILLLPLERFRGGKSASHLGHGVPAQKTEFREFSSSGETCGSHK